VRLPFRAPLEPCQLFGHLAATAVPGVEEWDGARYRRTLRLPHGHGILSAHPPAAGERHIAATLLLTDVRDLTAAVHRTRWLFDLDADPHGLFHRAHPDFDGHDGFAREDLVRWLTAAGCTRVEVTTATELVKEVDGVERTFPLFLAVGVTDPDAG